MYRQPKDALFVFRRQTTAQRALSVLAHGATYIGLTLCSPVLWLLMKLMPLLVVAAVIGELAMAYTYFAVRHQVVGGIMSLVNGAGRVLRRWRADPVPHLAHLPEGAGEMVSRRTALAIATPFAIAYAWCVAATVIFCAGIRHPEFLAFPYLQWFEAAGLFRLISWTARLWVVIAAVLPSVAVLIGVTAAVRNRRTPVRQREMKDKPLYGDRRLATERDLRAGSMNYR